jgi:hypothetical protein
MDVTESAFAVNFLALFSILFMAVGIYLAFSNKPMLRKTRAIILRLRPADVAKNPKEGAPVMATHSYKNHEIEVSTRDNGDFIEASAKFKPMHGYFGAFSMWGKFSSLEAAERTVLEEAKRIIDNRSK